MQKIIALVLLTAMFGQTFDQGWYYLDYQIQKKEYVKLCINKARPQLKCNGKCQLMKKIQEQEERERGLPPELKLAQKAELISQHHSLDSFYHQYDDTNTVYLLVFNIGYPIDQPSAVYHPPDIKA